MTGHRPTLHVCSRTLRQRVGVAVGLAVITACSREQIAPTVPEYNAVDVMEEMAAPEGLRLLPLRTYDGSGQSVHPDFLAPPPTWNQRLRYLAVTPYPGGTTKFENPALYAGSDGLSWGAAPGAPMPLAKPQEGYLSDPDLSYDPARNELVLYYRQASKGDRLFMIRSPDGRTWSKPALVLEGPFSTLLSPAVVRRGAGDWLMWTVNGAPGCNGASTSVSVRRSLNGADWSDPQLVNIPVAKDQFVWHLDVQWIPERQEYWALFPVKTKGNCTTTAVYLATSRDGMTWKTESVPVITAGVIPEFRHVVYRSTFAYNASTDDVTFWFSGARVSGKRVIWQTAVQRRSRSGLFFGAMATNATGIPSVAKGEVATFDPP